MKKKILGLEYLLSPSASSLISLTELDKAVYLIGVGVVALNGLLYVVGGDDGAANLASVEVYNPKTDTWAMLPSSMGIGRSYAGVAIIDRPM